MARRNRITVETRHLWDALSLGDKDFHILFGILAVLSESRDRGRIDLDDEDLGLWWLSNRIGHMTDDVDQAVCIFIKMGILTWDDQGFLCYEPFLPKGGPR